MSTEDNKVVTTTVIYNHLCMHCNKPFVEKEVVMAVGKPFMCMLHTICAPFFDYRNGWPHDKPLVFHPGIYSGPGRSNF